MSNNNDSNNKKDEEKAKDQKGDWSLWGVLGSAALVGAALLFAGSDSNNDNEELNARKKNISEEEGVVIQHSFDIEMRISFVQKTILTQFFVVVVVHLLFHPELAELFEGLDINVKRAKFIVGKGYNKDSLERTSEEELMKLLPNTSDHYKYSQYLQKRRKNNNMTNSNQDEIKVTPTLTRNQSDEEPPYLLCPISMELMTDPVIAADGHTYQRKSITVFQI